MEKKPHAVRRRVSDLQLAGEGGNHSARPLSAQLFEIASGGLVDCDSAADALEWGKALEVAAAFWLQRRRRHG